MGFVDVPIFTGDGLREWIDWLSDYFDQEHYVDLEKMNFAQSFMEGEARSWFQSRQSFRIFQNWDDLKVALLFRFGKEDDPERIRLLLAVERKWIHDPQHEVPVKSLGYRHHHSAFTSSNSLLKNIDVPSFNGASPFLWLLRIDKYFQSCQVVEDERLGRLSECLEGEAFFWFKKELFYGGFSSWSEFKCRLVARFTPVRRGSRQAVPHKPFVKSQTAEETASSPVNKRVETDKTPEEDSIQQLVVEVAHEKTPASQPLVSTCHNEKTVIVDDLPLAVDNSDEKSPGVLCTHSASKVFDTLPLKTEMMNMKLEQDKLSKSWKFKFKQGDVITEDGSLDAATSFDMITLLHEGKGNSIVESLDLQKEVILPKEQVFAKTEPVLEISVVEALSCSSPLKHVSTLESVTAIDHEEELVSLVSASLKSTRSAYHVLNELARRGLRLWHQWKHRRCSKSWHFKFKIWDVTAVVATNGRYKALAEEDLTVPVSQLAENHVSHQNMAGSSYEDLCGSTWFGDNGAIQRALPYSDICCNVLVTHPSQHSAHILIERGTTRLSYPCSEPKVGFIKKTKQRKNLKAWKFTYKYMELQRVKSVCGKHKLKNKKQRFMRLTTSEGRSEIIVNHGSSSSYYRVQSVLDSVQAIPRQEHQLFDPKSLMFSYLYAVAHVSVVKKKLRSSWDPGGLIRLDKAAVVNSSQPPDVELTCVGRLWGSSLPNIGSEIDINSKLYNVSGLHYESHKLLEHIEPGNDLAVHHGLLTSYKCGNDLVLLVIQLDHRSWEVKNKMQTVMIVGHVRNIISVLMQALQQALHGTDLLLLQGYHQWTTKTYILQQTTRGHKLFGIWHRWRSRGCIACAFGIVTAWEMHLMIFKSGDVWWVSSLLITMPLLHRLLSSQLEDKLHLKGALQEKPVLIAQYDSSVY